MGQGPEDIRRFTGPGGGGSARGRPAGGARGGFGSGAVGGQSRAGRIAEARRHISQRAWEAALKDLEPLLRKNKPDGEAMYLRGYVAEGMGRTTEAGEWAAKSIRAMAHPDAQFLLARCKRAAGETDEAVSLIDRVLRARPGDVHALVWKGGILEEAGRFEEARAVIGPLVEAAQAAGREPAPGVALEWAKLLVQSEDYARAIEILDRLIPGEPTPNGQRYELALRAKACDRMGDYAGAFESARRANEIGEVAFDADDYAAQVSVLIANWSRERMERFPISSCVSEVPVFVAGMPRSGTSLIDQIIDAHPKAAGVSELATIERFAGELQRAYDPSKEPPECLGPYDSKRWTREAEKYVREVERAGGRGVERVVNKALGNNKLVGLIARMFPKTRIIHAVRDPRDVAVSCFLGGFNNALHPWTTRLEWIAAAWEQSMRMMDHWKATLDVPILDVRYEELVRDPETQLPRIIGFLGLEWDDACREFHTSRRTVRTLSYDQVNRPLYTTSAGRWERYARWLEGVRFPAYG